MQPAGRGGSRRGINFSEISSILRVKKVRSASTAFVSRDDVKIPWGKVEI